MLRQMSQEDDDVAANLKELFADLLEDDAEEPDEEDKEEESGNQQSWVTDTCLMKVKVGLRKSRKTEGQWIMKFWLTFCRLSDSYLGRVTWQFG